MLILKLEMIKKVLLFLKYIKRKSWPLLPANKNIKLTKISIKVALKNLIG